MKPPPPALVAADPFRLLVADPPWQFSDKLPGPRRGAAKHYPTMHAGEICRFPLPPMADDSLLLLWRVSAMVEQACTVARAWGFVPKAEIVWIKKTTSGKRHFGMGRYVRAEHETCMVCARGRAHTLILSRSIRSTFEGQAGPVHSTKPGAFYALAEALFPGPRAELFATRPREGWTCYGLDFPRGPERTRRLKRAA